MADTTIQKREQDAAVTERLDEGVYYTPLVDILETNDAFVFEADLPGVKAQDADVTFEDGTLTIRGRVQQRQAQEQAYTWREYGVGHFYRSFTLETPVHGDGISAELKGGVLKVRLPKAEAAKTKRINIKSA